VATSRTSPLRLLTSAQVEELSEAALESDSAEIRAIGEQVASTLRQREGLENLAPSLSVDILESELHTLRRACRDLG
jgi:hypothetical protein